MKTLCLSNWKTMIRWEEIPGDGPAIVCLPGISTAAVPTFLPLALQPALCGRRFLIIDYIGSGTSGSAPDFPFTLEAHAATIAAVMDAAEITEATILGHSMGGTVGVALALARPDLVASLFVGEGNMTPGGGKASATIAAYDLDDWCATGFQARAEALEHAAQRGDWLAQFLCGARIGVDPRGLHGNARMLVHVPTDFLARFLALPMPRHFVYGAQTFPTSAQDAGPDTPDPDLLRRHGVGVHVVPGVGHQLMVEDPAAFADTIAPLL